MAKGPVLIDLDETTAARQTVSDAPPVPDVVAVPQGQAMQAAARLAARRPSVLARLFWALATALVGAIVSIAAWNFVNDLIAQNPVLG